jgi:aspartate 1-decarboxylase
MLYQVLKGKIHRATVTDHNLEYEGSITVDGALMEAAGMKPFEKVAVWNVTNGNRFETYLMEGEAGGGEMVINGAAAHLAKKGDQVIVAAFCLVDENSGVPHRPRMVYVDEDNRPIGDEQEQA